MITLIDTALEKYAEQHSCRPSPLLDELEQYTYSNCSDPQMVTGALQGGMLRMLVQLTGARSILEIGLFTGYSALTMAEVLPDGGRIVSCELNSKNADIARTYLERSGLAGRVDIRIGPALDTIAALAGPFDLVFLDADKENYSNYYDLVLPKLNPGGLIVADNVLWSGRVLNPESETDHAIAAFNDKVAQDPAVEVVLLTVRDGVSLIRRRT